MRKVALISILTLFIIPMILNASNQDSSKTRVGAGGNIGFSQNNTITGDIYGGVFLPINSDYGEANLGYSFLRNETDYVDVDGLDFNSRVIYLEGNYYFLKGLYAGFRYGISLNWVDETSQEEFEARSRFESPEFFLGQTFNLQAGYLIEFDNHFSLRFQGQVGIHNFEIAEGNYWQLGGTSQEAIERSEFPIESKFQIIYNLSVGFTYRIDADIY